MKPWIIVVFAVTLSISNAQSAREHKPKLVVGIIVDQMRQEYLYRFNSKFGTGGFKRLVNDGFMLKNAHYNYVPTITGPGHASVYTGSTPAVHGIIANEWYDKNLKKTINCVNDPQQKPVGNDEAKGEVSPWRLLSSTITDELKLSTQKRAKVISLSFKDRGAILPAGHLGNAFWYDSKSGKFITSTYYTQTLPGWVDQFNQLGLADKYLSQEWKTLLPIEQYTESGPDDNPYESRVTGKDKPVFPYNLRELRARNGNFDLLFYVPYADDYLTEFVKTAVDAEKLGEDDVPDFLAISYSTPDAIGHAFGPNSIEIEDAYLRLDKNIEDLLKTLDQKVGQGNYTVFLTADHGVNEVAQYLKDSKIPAGYFSEPNTKARLNEFLQKYFPGRELVETIDDGQVYFDQGAFHADPKSSGVELLVATELAINFLLAQDGVANAYSENVIRQSQYGEEGVKGLVVRGYHAKRSGDIVIVLEPGWYASPKIQGTTHGSPYTYDTHVPVIFFGNGIKKGESVRRHSITDIAPTISVILNIKYPSGCTGNPVVELFEDK
jgi:predicted AlkP superfamily pyrophosphatase or phosphodiesterase